MFFKGYVKTNNKKCMEKFKNRKDFKTYEEVKDLPEFAGILDADTILIDVDDQEQSELLMNIVETMQLNCRVYKTTRGKHFLFKNSKIEKCYTASTLACGLTADIKSGFTNSYSILKFEGKERFIEWDIEEGQAYQEVPKFLFPIKANVDFLEMKAGDGRNQALFNYILTLQANDFSIGESREIIQIINKFVIKEPLTDNELEVILRDDAFKKPIFYKGQTFLFDVFATFLKNNHYIKRIDNQLHLYKDGIYISGLAEIENAMIRHIPSLSKAKRAEVLSYLDVSIRENTIPENANVIAFKNGVYDLAISELQSFTPDKVITNKIPWDYNESAFSTSVDNVLNNISCNDKEVRLLIEEMVGYCMYRRNELGKAFILTGASNNGKSTFLNMLRRMIGNKNTSVLDLKKLADRFSTVMLFGKLANIGDDISDDFLMDASEFKKIVTGEAIDAEQKGQPKFDFEPYVKLIFSSNNIPRIGRGRDSSAVLRRLVIIPFNAEFSVEKLGKEFKPYIKDELENPEGMEYLIQVGLSGLKRVLATKQFTTNAKIQKELKEYEETNNPIIGFFNDTELEEIENEATNDVYRRYCVYCQENTLLPLSKGEFSKQVKKQYHLIIISRRIKGTVTRIFVKE